ncbi:hypothetical protein [Wenxinia saemankumensis]|uniref:O-Antigen ligase n=1 Tax=Wenxinia saemankumensis TaxID=1447782 RepID=A0A1M6FZX0_9RHOB|nr:hypothetical protein [Wenxinia saemankumensis]SHJ03263.1 hypothetical protein SAMN05444417_2598 [Wenxinia saemankumensis]
MPNAIAILALLSWPLVSLGLFRWLPAGRALIASIVVAYLLLPPLPAAFDLPLLPPLTKDTLPPLVALVLCLLLHPGRIELIPRSPPLRALLALYILAPVATVLTNGEPIFFVTAALPGLGPHESLAMMVQQGLQILPLLLARSLLRESRDARDMLWALAIGGLVYSLPMLLEVRLAPVLNLRIYGYFQHDFGQMVRDGGYRPMVFLYHGLWAAFLAMSAALAALALAREEGGRRSVSLLAAAGYMLVVLVLCKSMASLVYAIAFAPLVAFAPALTKVRLAAAIAVLALVYPMAKGAHLVPEDEMLAAATSIDAERANSLAFRFEQERLLLDRAAEKPLFGWGSYGRNHLHDPVDGTILTIADGRWVITIGVLGWLGFLAEFGLLTLPILTLAWRARGMEGGTVPGAVAALTLLHAINLVDLLPNATLSILTWTICGALIGQAERFVPVRRSAAQPVRTVL